MLNPPRHAGAAQHCAPALPATGTSLPRRAPTRTTSCGRVCNTVASLYIGVVTNMRVTVHSFTDKHGVWPLPLARRAPRALRALPACPLPPSFPSPPPRSTPPLSATLHTRLPGSWGASRDMGHVCQPEPPPSPPRVLSVPNLPCASVLRAWRRTLRGGHRGGGRGGQRGGALRTQPGGGRRRAARACGRRRRSA
eukprot:3022993-Rhodomonas_salina.2